MTTTSEQSGPFTVPGLDPITFEVIRHRLWAINDDQARMAARLSGSFIVYEGYDFNAALVTADGRGLYCGVYILQHGATIDEFVRKILDEWPAEEIREGDMFFTNDPWWGALHANDGILAMPIFWAGELVAWSGIVMHDSDVGSPVPGSFVTGAADRFGEAPLFPAIKLVERFEPRRDVERAYLRNSRTPEQNALNMRARVAALRTTHGRICELVERYGIATFHAVQEGIIAYVERVLRGRLREIPDGSWLASGYHDHDGNSDEIYRICCRLTKRADRLCFDMAGTAPQAPGPINCARPALEGVIMGVILTVLCYDLPWAIGGLREIAQIEAADGTLVTALSPAAVSMASIMAGLSVQDVVADTVAQMLLGSERHRSEAQASWSPGICGGTFAATLRDGSTAIALLSESFGGGGGARSFADGIDSGGVFHSMASRIANVEALESRGRLLEIYRREACDGGGAGRFRGGAGLEFAVTPHKVDGAGRLITRSSGVSVPAGHGLAGGRPGSPVGGVVLRGSNVRELFAGGSLPTSEQQFTAREVLVLEAKALTALSEGDVVIAGSAGGAGYGDPLRRDPELVARDVRGGLVSEAGARDAYGVIAPGGVCEPAATERARQAIRRARLREGRLLHDLPMAAERSAPERGRSVSDTVAAVGGWLRCTVCGHALGADDVDLLDAGIARELPLAALGARFARCRTDYVLREHACPGCGTAFAAALRARTDGASAGARPRGGSA
ncbi:MAG TPA: hydantoinase B/oxoprolinase family protein [Solirubrobacteraceae bacterium]|nr:hydantoinase B/oxoprolinase family protein [Solirubrobacteraceae bacterium]